MENTIENNKLIAEFMGFEKQIMHGHPWFGCANADAYIPDYGLKYHSSWDWLMPVVEKIDSISFKGYEEGFDFVMRDRCFSYVVSADALIEVADGESRESRIEATYKAVVQFITWYNSQSK